MMQARENDLQGAERVGRVIGGRWILDRVLGSGGMATVYEAHDSTGMRAAVKVLHPNLAMSADMRARFEREVEVTSNIRHPGIVRVLDQDASAPQDAYIAMELLEGRTLRQLTDPGGKLEARRLLALVDQVLDVLAQAHDIGVIHRDLKPDNLFVTRNDQVKLLDFGVARLIDPAAQAAQTRTGLALGTAAYMAPEQALGKRSEVDARTDIFAIGAILFRLLSGRRIHDVETDGELIAAMATKPAPRFASVVPDADRRIAAIIDVALGFNRSSRYPDARTMQTDVRAVLSGKPPPFAQSSVEASEQITVAPARGHGAERDKSSLVGEVVAGRYRVLELLGAGGMGTVYRAQHVHMRKAVALKVLHREMTYVPEVVARFEREAIAAARIEHPNVAAATDFGKLENGSFYLVLEYVEGHSLAHLLREGRALAPERAVRIVRQIASALAAAHAAGIVHRDLKPDNVMLVERGDNPDVVKVLDFGIAKVTAEDMRAQPALTQLGSVFGTPEYMSPEQAMGQPVDKRSDLYSLGIILHEMLSGRGVPFSGDDMMATLTMQMTAAPPPLPSTVPESLVAITMRLLAKRPDARFGTADELVAHLTQIDVSAVSLAQIRAGDVPDPSSAITAVGYSDTVYSVASPGAPSAPGAVAGLANQRDLADRMNPDHAGSVAAPTAIGVLVAALRRWTEQHSVVDRVQRRLRRSVTVGRQHVPVWLLVSVSGGALLLGVCLVLLFAALSREDVDERPSRERPVEKTAAPVVSKRAGGAPSAVKPVEREPVATPAMLTMPGRSLTRLHRFEAAVRAYAEALHLNANLATDPGVLADLRLLAEQPESMKEAQDLASGLGTPGADLLYDVWYDLKDDAKKANVAREARTRLGDAKGKSEALQVALELQQAKTCDNYRVLLPKAIEHADNRSLQTLEALQKWTPCATSGGRFGWLTGKRKQDCWACLRGDDKLDRAVDRAKSRPAPQFDPIQ